MEQHITSLIPDYALGLLSAADTARVENHVATCGQCRQALDEEQAFTGMIQQTLHIATQPRLRQLQRNRTATLPRRRPISIPSARQFAPVMLLLAILAGTLALQTTRTNSGFNLTAPGFYVLHTPTATSTSTPTATLADLHQSDAPAGISIDSTQAADAATTVPPNHHDASPSHAIQAVSTPVIVATK